MGRNTFFLSLSFPQVEDASPYVEQMCQDVDSMEYRVDLLSAAKDYLSMMTNAESSCNSDDPRFDILYQQQRLRALCRPHAQRWVNVILGITPSTADATHTNIDSYSVFHPISYARFIWLSFESVHQRYVSQVPVSSMMPCQ